MPVNYRNLAHSFLEKTVPTMIDLVDVTHELDVNPVKSHKSRTAPAPRLRYLKFKAKDVAKTAEFYQSMGMNMDYKLVIPLVVRDELIPATELNTKTLMAFSYPPITLSKEDYDARHQEGIIESNDKKPNFQIIFEHTPLAPVELSEEEKKILSQKGSSEPQTRVSQKSPEYLVFYVHFLARLAKKITAKGFQVVVAPVDLSETKLAIFKDPNGVEIRIFELTDEQAGSKRTWAYRMAYYTLPCFNIQDSCSRYEKLLAFGKGNGRKERKRSVTEEIAKKSNANEIIREFAKSFRSVDVDDFVIGLSKTSFAWMGNEVRTDDFTICWTDKRELGTEPELPSLKSTKLCGDILLAIGFQVSNIETFTSRHQKGEKSTISPVEGEAGIKVRVPGVGQYQKFFDGINKLNVEIFCPGSGKDSKTIEADKKKALLEKDLVKPVDLTRSQVFTMTKDPLPGIKLDKRFPSAGAIEVKTVWVEEKEEVEEESDDSSNPEDGKGSTDLLAASANLLGSSSASLTQNDTTSLESTDLPKSTAVLSLGDAAMKVLPEIKKKKLKKVKMERKVYVDEKAKSKSTHF